MTQPLAGLKVLDFSTLLPGPLCFLLLAEAGAEVIKFERPGRGDEMRSYEPKADKDGPNFVLLNRGKMSVAIDLKSPAEIASLVPLIQEADVLLEQFRPGWGSAIPMSPKSIRALCTAQSLALANMARRQMRPRMT